MNMGSIIIKRRSCDRCSRHKQKCRYEIEGEICTACSTSQAICSTLRPRIRQGRRPNVQRLGLKKHVHIWETNTTTTKPSNQRRQMVEHNVSEFVCPVAASGHPTSFLIHDPDMDSPFESSPDIIIRFSKDYSVFMSTPRFAPSFRTALQKSYACAPILLRDIFRVVFVSISPYFKNSTMSTTTMLLNDQSNIMLRTVSLQKLRTAKVLSIQHAFAIVALGQTLAAYELMTNCIGSMLILRYSLNCAKWWYGEMAMDHTMDPIVIAPVLWDTVQCVVKGEIPIVRFLKREKDEVVVDKMVGICTGLLGTLYDLCVLSQRAKELQRCGSDISTACIKQIEQKINCWVPRIPSDLTSTFSHLEIMGMEIQASMYQKASLLKAHRVCSPIGTEDLIAVSLAQQILLEFSRYSTLVDVENGAKMPYVVLPILLAALEISDVSREIWDSMALLSLAPVCAGKIADFVEFVWERRRHGFAGYMWELVDEGPDFIVVP